MRNGMIWKFGNNRARQAMSKISFFAVPFQVMAVQSLLSTVRVDVDMPLLWLEFFFRLGRLCLTLMGININLVRSNRGLPDNSRTYHAPTSCLKLVAQGIGISEPSWFIPSRSRRCFLVGLPTLLNLLPVWKLAAWNCTRCNSPAGVMSS